MKTTFDLPPDLVREVKLRAVHEGRKLKDMVAEVLKRGLSSETTSRTAPTATKGAIKLPLFPSPKTAPASRMSMQQLLVLEQETLNQEDHQRLGLSV
jgi:plasmid stability protein